jgi:DNA-binding GntR family transcriptional regulator
LNINRLNIIGSLREAIVNLELAPGQPISETSVGEKFKISRTLVREILRKLESEYLLEIYPNRGAFVTNMSVDYIEEIFQMREALEGMAARISAHKIPSKEMQKIRDQLEALNKKTDDSVRKEAVQVGDVLHSLIGDISNNRHLRNTMRFLNYHFLRIRKFLEDNHPGTTESDISEHIEIINAILSGNGSLAEEVMRNHIRNTKAKMYMRLANKGEN